MEAITLYLDKDSEMLGTESKIGNPLGLDKDSEMLGTIGIFRAPALRILRQMIRRTGGGTSPARCPFRKSTANPNRCRARTYDSEGW